MRKMVKKLGIISGVLVFAIFTMVLLSNSVAAESKLKVSGAKERIINKSYVQGMYRCYTLKVGDRGRGANDNGTDYDDIKDETQLDYNIELKGEHRSKYFGSYKALFPSPDSSNKIGLPNGWTAEKSGDGQTNCAHLANGGDGFADTVYQRLGASFSSTTSSEKDKKEFHEKMGYAASSSLSGKQCIKFNIVLEEYDASGNLSGNVRGPMLTNKICFNVEDGKIANTEIDGDDEYASSDPVLMGQCDNYEVCLAKGLDDSDEHVYLRMVDANNNELFNDRTSMTDYYEEVSVGSKWEDVVTSLENGFCGKMSENMNFDNASFTYFDSSDMPNGGIYYCKKNASNRYVETSGGGETTTNYKIEDSSKAVNSMIKHLSGDNNTKKDDLALTISEKVYTYQHYLKDIGAATVDCTATEAPDSSYKSVKWFQTSDKREDCFIKINKVDDGTGTGSAPTVNKIDDSYWFTTDKITFDKVIDYLNGVTITKLKEVSDEDIATMAENPSVGSGDDETTTTYDCYSRAESLGWVLCPIIDNLGDYIQNTYEQHITNFLVLDAELFKNGGTITAWRNFQNIANVFFVVIFLFVILSQLTGFGIDNYGIKKILPKLILGAIFINLSYVICQVVMDMANIVGYGIGWIFENIGTKITEVSISEAGSSSGGGAVAATAIIVVLVVALVGGAVLAIGPAVLVPVFLGLIAIAIAILSCFVILSVRKALAVVLVVISPVAFVCYMLPNTRSLYNKWFKAFEGVIIAFPVCSAMIYGGQAVARLIINASGGTTIPFMLALSAAVISVIPMYFIPRVVSKSMGAISAGINGVATRARIAGQNRYRNSNGAQDRMLRSRQLQNARAAGQTRFSGWMRKRGDNIQKGLENRLGNVPIAGSIVKSRGNARNQRLARANQRYANDQSEIDKAARMMDPRNLEQQMFNDRVKNYMDSAEFESDTQNNNVEAMLAFLKGADMSNDENRMKARAMGKALASSAQGKKDLSKAIRNGSIGGDVFKELSKDAGIRNAIHDKDQFVSAAMDKSAADGSTTWDSWYNGADKEKNIASVTAGLDKSDLYSQSGAAFTDALGAKALDSKGNLTNNLAVSDERLAADMANQNIDMGDKRDTIAQLRPDVKASDSNSEVIDAINKMTDAYNKNTEQLKVNHNDAANNTGHNAQQGGVGNGATINTGGSGTVEPHSPYKLK